MTRKDYETFAGIIRGEVATAPTSHVVERAAVLHTLRVVMLSTADMFARDNGRFNRELFYTACGFTADGFALQEDCIPDDMPIYDGHASIYDCHLCGLAGGH